MKKYVIEDADLVALAKIARKATKGNWIAVGRWVENDRDDLPDVVICDGERGSDKDSYRQQCADAEHIACFNPKFVLKLLDELQWLRSTLEYWEQK